MNGSPSDAVPPVVTARLDALPGAQVRDEDTNLHADQHADVLLFTPAQAARLLSVPESWLRRKAGRRLIPCTFLGKHLRFSGTDVRSIADAGSQPIRRPRQPRRF